MAKIRRLWRDIPPEFQQETERSIRFDTRWKLGLKDGTRCVAAVTYNGLTFQRCSVRARDGSKFCFRHNQQKSRGRLENMKWKAHLRGVVRAYRNLTD